MVARGPPDVVHVVDRGLEREWEVHSVSIKAETRNLGHFQPDQVAREAAVQLVSHVT